MLLKDMVNTLRTETNIVEVRDKDNYPIGTFNQGSNGLEPYLNKTVISWFPGAAPFHNATFTVLIDAE